MEEKNRESFSTGIKKIKDDRAFFAGSLLFEASSDKLVACIKSSDGFFYCIEENVKHKLQEKIFVVLEALSLFALKERNEKPFSLVGVGCGPGSYTSVRVSVSSARAISQAAGCPVLPLNSLEVLAFSFWLSSSCAFGNFFVVRDAKMGQVYAQEFSSEDKLTRLSSEKVISINELAEETKKRKVQLIVTDTPEMLSVFKTQAEVIIAEPDSIGLIEAASSSLNYGNLKNWNEIFPIYLRLSYAEMKQNKK